MPPATATQIARETSILEPGVLAASATATPFSYAQEKSAGASETPCPAEFSSLRAMTLPPPESPTQGETVLGQTTETETLSLQPEAAAASSADAVPGRSSWLTPLRSIEAALAILALLLAAAAIRFRRLRR